MTRIISTILAFVIGSVALAQGTGDVRRPRGIYAKVNITSEITQQTKANPSITPAQLNAYFNNLYQDLLSNPAISGLALQVHWDTVNPNPPADSNPYDWGYVDDAFNQASLWTVQNPTRAPKTIQLILTPGFQTPQWVLDQIPSCDPLFQISPQTPPANCGRATFVGYGEEADGTQLPLPWNPFYKSSWKAFLTALAARYGSNPAFVSIAVGGPTAASEEMILPNNNNTPRQSAFGGILANDMWLQLLAFHYPGMPAYQKSDQAFIDEWNSAIDMYGQIFSGLTLVATTGSGLPNFGNNGFTIPSAFSADCGRRDMDCAAETTILAHFVDPTVGGANAKATQTSGVEASRMDLLNLGLDGVKRLSQSTAQFTAPAAQILGGAQFNTSFANNTLTEGCTSKFPPDASDTPTGCSIPPSCGAQGCIPVACIPQACLAPGVTPADLSSFKTLGNVPGKYLIPPEQAEYNVLDVCYGGTVVASFFGATQGAAPLNYLQIYYPDIQYAEANVNAPAQVVETGGTTVSMSAQDLLNLASQKLLSISEPAPAITLVANAEGESPVIAPNTWVEIKGVNLGPVGFSRTWGGSDFANSNMPTQVNGVSTTVNGKSAFIYYVSPEQVNILTPPDAMSGSVQVQVTNNGATSASFTAQAQALAPSFFVFNGGPYVAATHVNGSFLGPASLYPGATTPAQPGETIVLYANGFGPTSTPVVSGSASQSGTLSPLPVVNIGGATATVTFAGLVSPGEFQFNVIVPPNTPNGDQPIAATYNGAATQAGTLVTIQH